MLTALLDLLSAADAAHVHQGLALLDAMSPPNGDDPSLLPPLLTGLQARHRRGVSWFREEHPLWGRVQPAHDDTLGLALLARSPLAATTTSLCLGPTSRLTDLSPLLAFPALERLEIHGAHLSAWPDLSAWPNLQHLGLHACEGPAVLEVRRAPHLRSLRIERCNAQIVALSQLERLQEVRVCAWELRHLQANALPRLRALRLSSNGQLLRVLLAEAPALQHVSVDGCWQLAEVQGFEGTKVLHAGGCWRLPPLSTPNATHLTLDSTGYGSSRTLPRLPATLQHLSLHNQPGVTDLGFVADLPALRSLQLGHNPRLTDLSALRAAPQLERLTLQRCRQVHDLSPVAHLTSLRALHLTASRDLSDLPLPDAPLEVLGLGQNRVRTRLPTLRGFQNLQQLQVVAWRRLEGVEEIAGLGVLTRLALPFCRVPDLAPLASLPCLEVLDLREAFGFSSVEPLLGLSMLRRVRLSPRCAALPGVAALRAQLAPGALEL